MAVFLLFLCLHDLVIQEPRRVSSPGLRVIPAALDRDRRAVRPPSANEKKLAHGTLAAIPALVLFCAFSFIAAALVGEAVRPFVWREWFFTFQHGADRPVMRAAHHSVLGGVFMTLLCYSSLALLRGLNR